MRWRFHADDGLPRLAWCATLRVGDEAAEVRHGPWVETAGQRFVEGAWDGPFAASRPDEAWLIGGTAGVATAGGVVFATSTSPYNRIFTHRSGDVLRVSNSLAFLLVAAGDAPDPHYPYYWPDFRAHARAGASRERRSIRTRDGAFGTFEACNVEVGPDLLPRRVSKRVPPPPREYAEYRDLVDGAVTRLVGNALDPARRRTYAPLVALSAGYDSSALAVFAARAGCREAVTLLQPGTDGRDGGAALAERLGMSARGVVRRDRDWAGDVGAEAEFVACPPGAASPFACLADALPGRLLLRGEGGDRLLSLDPRMWLPDLQCTMGWPVWSTTEMRLRLGYLNVMPLNLAWQHREALTRISASGAMRPWSVGGDYDRPVARRIVEEAGIPRDAFAREKLATAHRWIVHADHLSDAARADYEAFVDRLGLPPSFFRAVRRRHRLASLSRRWNRSVLPGSRLALGRSCRSPRATGFLWQWAHEHVRARYAAAAPTTAARP